MAPVIQEAKPKAEQPLAHKLPGSGSSSGSLSASGSGSRSSAGASRGERRNELLVRVKYGNTLPDIPFDAKFLIYPFDSNRFVQYKPTSLERNYKHDILSEHDLGVVIDLINPETYVPRPGLNIMHPEDERLVEDEETKGVTDPKRSRHHNKTVPWLKKTEYISTEFNRYGASSNMSETKVGFNIRKKMDEPLFLDRDAQIAAIETTFVEASKPITKHHSKPHLTVVEEMPLLPDYDLWKFPFAQVTFDAEPVQSQDEYQQRRMTQALLRGVMDESGQQFVAYFLPTGETLEKRERDEAEGISFMPADEYEYKSAKEYTWNVKNKNSQNFEQHHFFIVRDGVAYYNEIESKVRLNKRRANKMSVANSTLVVTHRDLNDPEIRTQNARMRLLEPPRDDDEEEEPEEEAFENKPLPVSIKQQVKEEREATQQQEEEGAGDGQEEEERPTPRDEPMEFEETHVQQHDDDEEEDEEMPQTRERKPSGDGEEEDEEGEAEKTDSPRRIKEERGAKEGGDSSSNESESSRASSRASGRGGSDSDEVKREDPNEVSDEDEKPSTRRVSRIVSESDESESDAAGGADSPDENNKKGEKIKEIFGSDSDSESD